VDGAPDWSPFSRSLAFYLSGAAERDADLYVISNAWEQPLKFRIREPGPWRLVADTSAAPPKDFFEPGKGRGLRAASMKLRRGPRCCWFAAEWPLSNGSLLG